VKQAVDGFITSVQTISKPTSGIWLQIMGDKKDYILGLIFDPDCEWEVEGIESEINTPSKWVHMGLTDGARR